MVALMALCIVAGRRKIGVVPAVVIGAVVFVGLTVLGFSGGRAIGASEDRLEAWSIGIMLIRSHPIFGVGFQKFSEFNEITAHNTFVVCAAELGLVGAFCWVLLTLVTVRNVFVTATDPEQEARDRQKKLDAANSRQPFLQGIPSLTDAALAPATASVGPPTHQFSGPGMPFVLPAASIDDRTRLAQGDQFGFINNGVDGELDDAEIRRMASIMVISFAGFLTAGWFLSRAYTMCLYVNAGMAAAIYKMARDRGIAPPPMPTGEAMKLTAKIMLALVVIVYLAVRVDHLMPH